MGLASGDGEVNAVVKELTQREAPKFQHMHLFEFYCSPLAHDFAQLGDLTSLSTLVLRHLDVDTIPCFPNLSDVRLEYVECSIRKLYQFFCSSPAPVHAVLTNAVSFNSFVEDPPAEGTRPSQPPSPAAPKDPR